MSLKKITLEEASRQYLGFLHARGMGDGTLAANKSFFRMFLSTVNRDMHMCNLDGRHVEKFFTAYAWKPRTVNLRLTLLRQFVTWAKGRGYYAQNNDPTLGWRNTKPIDAPKTRIPVSQWNLIFDICHHPVDEAIVRSGLFLFIRSSEYVGLTWEHVDLERNTILIFRKKTRQYDEMPMAKELADFYRTYRVWYQAEVARLNLPWKETYALLPARDNTTMTKVGNEWELGSGEIMPNTPLRNMTPKVNRLLRRAGLVNEDAKGEGCHTLRRSGARAYFDALVDQGYDGALRRVMAMLGHSSTQMTERYLGLSLDIEKRNRDLAGKLMFPGLAAPEVVPFNEGGVRRENARAMLA